MDLQINENNAKDKSCGKIMDDPKYSFMTWPRICLDETPEMVVMVLTAPKNFDSRSKIRETLYEFNVNSTNKVKPLFLIGGSGGGLDTLQASIDNEVKANGDILQSSVYEGYGLLSFKTNVGYIWSSCFCPKTKYVMKVDDNAEINYSVLLQQLKTKNGPDGGLPFGAIFCPSPMRNMRPWYPRPSGGFKTVMGKWSVKTYEMSRRVYPDFCPGWAYVTSPATGIRLAEMSANLPENLKRLKRLDDIFFSGVTREHVAGTRVEQLSGEGTWMGSLWNDHLSYCPFLGITKNMFFNDVVIAKKTTIDMQGGWFLWCAFWEYFILDPGEFLLPDILPNCMINMCHR